MSQTYIQSSSRGPFKNIFGMLTTYIISILFLQWQHRNDFEFLPSLLWESKNTVYIMLQVKYPLLWLFLLAF